MYYSPNNIDKCKYKGRNFKLLQYDNEQSRISIIAGISIMNYDIHKYTIFVRILLH